MKNKSMNNIEQITNLFSLFRIRIVECFSINCLAVKHISIRNQQIRIDVDRALSEFDKELLKLDPDQIILDEFENLKKFLKTEIIFKNKNIIVDQITKKAINSNFKYLLEKLELKQLLHEEALIKISSENKEKFEDVMVQNIELALFIKLAKKYGLITYNGNSDILRAKCFSLLTNFSEKSLRNSITGSTEKNENLKDLDQKNIDNLRSILGKIDANLINWQDKLKYI